MANLIRRMIFSVLSGLEWLKLLDYLGLLCRRALFTEIGYTGYLSNVDQKLAKDDNLKLLNWFEKWLMKPVIEEEQVCRRAAFKQAYTEVTGENCNW